MDRVDQKLTLQKLKVLMQGYRKLTNNEMLSLLETARDFFHLLESVGKTENIKKVCKCLVAQRSDPENRDYNLWTFSALFLQTFIFLGRKQEATFVQRTDKPSI